MIGTGGGDFMKRILTTVFLLASVFCAPADCPDNPCPTGITSILDCPDEGCRQSAFDPNHPYDAELNKRKNVRSDAGYKEKWRKLESKQIKIPDDPASFAKDHGVANYYKTLLKASEGDVKAFAQFNSLTPGASSCRRR
jgi:hypothetical protein